MSWIDTISYENSTGKLRKLYDRVKGPDDNVDNIMMAHSLRPHTMEGHMFLYKYVLHHTGNAIDKWFLEAIGVLASILNGCDYCIEHHFSGMARLIGNEANSSNMRRSLETNSFDQAFNVQQTAALNYAKKLTVNPAQMEKEDIEELRNSGWSDGEILEINQVTAYFNYANRTVLGLGVNTSGDILGLSPHKSNDPDDWNHK